MIRTICSFVVSVSIVGCGGGDGDNSSETSQLPNYYLQDAPSRLNEVGDKLIYEGSYDGAYYDGSGVISIKGKCDFGYYGVDFSITDVPPLTLAKFECENDTAGNLSTYEYVTIGDNSEIIKHYDGDGYFHNYPTGAIMFPESLKIGQSWTNSYYAINYDSGFPKKRLYSELYTVEEISWSFTKIGSFQAYKISYDFQYDPDVGFDNFAEHGTFWYYPGVGIIERNASGTIDLFNYEYSYTLMDTNLKKILIQRNH